MACDTSDPTPFNQARIGAVLGVQDATAAQAAHSAHEAAVAKFLAAAKRRNPERFKRVCESSPVLTRWRWRQIIAHEVLGDFGLR